MELARIFVRFLHHTGHTDKEQVTIVRGSTDLRQHDLGTCQRRMSANRDYSPIHIRGLECVPFSKPYHCSYPQRTRYWNQITNNSIDGGGKGVGQKRCQDDLFDMVVWR